MSNSTPIETKAIKMLIGQASALKKIIEDTLKNSAVSDIGRYVSFKSFARSYEEIARQSEKVLHLPNNSLAHYDIEHMPSSMDSVWPVQKEIMESVFVQTTLILRFLEGATDYVDNEVDNLENFFSRCLRSALFSVPEKEVQVQDAVETLLIGKNFVKGIDYDRETGKIEFSGKEYIPDFIIPSLNMCIEIKLLRMGRKSKIIEEISADITAYGKLYPRIMFIIYDLGVIRDCTEFCRDIENSGNIKVIIIKH